MSAFPGEEIQQIAADAVRLVQLTDCHIFADAGKRLYGLDTRHSFEAVSADALAEYRELDLLLATGDLSQDASAESYRYLAEHFDAMDLPVFWLPGNHDDSTLLGEHFVGGRISPAKQVLAGAWQIVLLDSTIGGVVHGRVASDQLDFLDAAVNAHPERHALVCLHHQALATGSKWIDDKGLREAEEFRRRVTSHDQVRAVIWGHVHQDKHHKLDSIEWMSTPSSCVQFTPDRDEFAISDESPGYRYLSLHADGSIETRVHRVGLD